MHWKETPKSRRITARRFDPITGAETPCDYRDLKPGDFFRSFAGDNQIDPMKMELCEDQYIAAFVCGAPQPAVHRGEGYEVEIISGPWPALRMKVAN